MQLDTEQTYPLPDEMEPGVQSCGCCGPDPGRGWAWPDEPELDAAARRTFKDFAVMDIDGVFFELDEFAEMHNIDGRDMPVVIETDKLKDHSSHWEAGSKQNYDTGLYDARFLLYVKAKDYGPAPKVKKRLILDGDKRMYQVLEHREESGVYRMLIGRVRL